MQSSLPDVQSLETAVQSTIKRTDAIRQAVSTTPNAPNEYTIDIRDTGNNQCTLVATSPLVVSGSPVRVQQRCITKRNTIWEPTINRPSSAASYIAGMQPNYNSSLSLQRCWIPIIHATHTCHFPWNIVFDDETKNDANNIERIASELVHHQLIETVAITIEGCVGITPRPTHQTPKLALFINSPTKLSFMAIANDTIRMDFTEDMVILGVYNVHNMKTTTADLSGSRMFVEFPAIIVSAQKNSTDLTYHIFRPDNAGALLPLQAGSPNLNIAILKEIYIEIRLATIMTTPLVEEKAKPSVSVIDAITKMSDEDFMRYSLVMRRRKQAYTARIDLYKAFDSELMAGRSVDDLIVLYGEAEKAKCISLLPGKSLFQCALNREVAIFVDPTGYEATLGDECYPGRVLANSTLLIPLLPTHPRDEAETKDPLYKLIRARYNTMKPTFDSLKEHYKEEAINGNAVFVKDAVSNVIKFNPLVAIAVSNVAFFRDPKDQDDPHANVRNVIVVCSSDWNYKPTDIVFQHALQVYRALLTCGSNGIGIGGITSNLNEEQNQTAIKIGIGLFVLYRRKRTLDEMTERAKEKCEKAKVVREKRLQKHNKKPKAADATKPGSEHIKDADTTQTHEPDTKSNNGTNAAPVEKRKKSKEKIVYTEAEIEAQYQERMNSIASRKLSEVELQVVFEEMPKIFIYRQKPITGP